MIDGKNSITGFANNKYDIVDVDSIWKDGMYMNNYPNSNHSYGMLSNIYHSDFVFMDIDDVKAYDREFIIRNNKISAVEKMMAIPVAFHLVPQVEYIDIYLSGVKTTGDQERCQANHKTSFNFHYVIKLNDVYDTSGFYGNLNAELNCCFGHLRYCFYSGHSLIRVAPKFMKDRKKSNVYAPIIIARLTKDTLTSYMDSINTMIHDDTLWTQDEIFSRIGGFLHDD